MRDKVCIVTGANTGIGFEIVRALAKLQAHVVIVSRNELKSIAAQEAIQSAIANSKVDLVVGDLGSIEGTRLLAEKLTSAYEKIHVLINNAGVWMTERKLNGDGLEQSFMTNHLAPFMLNQLLLPNLQAAPARFYFKFKAEVSSL